MALSIKSNYIFLVCHSISTSPRGSITKMPVLKDLQLLLQLYPNKQDVVHQYGTAGFRNKADRLSHVISRIGILAALRARYTKAVVGVMITASHNPADDNGVKIIEPSGNILEQSWEKFATAIANIPDSELDKHVEELIGQQKIDMAVPGKVYIGQDTRKSSPSLCKALIAGIQAIDGEFVDFGILTTPQLHYIVRCCNDRSYGEPSEEGYCKKLSKAYLSLFSKDSPKRHLVVDCANGVGANQLKKLVPYLNGQITFEILNDGSGTLNHMCGADFVKTNQKEPCLIALKPGQNYVSFDGDADRIIYYYQNSKDGKFHMLDGDKIAVLIAKYLRETLVQAGLKDIPITIIQTAYANGSSTSYIEKVLQAQTFCVPTGVKHLHHQAEQSEIGIYFEANGHGTVLFSDKVQKQIKELQGEKARKLEHFIDLVNQTVGDAISDMLVVEAILEELNMNIEQWDSMYTDLPNKLLKLGVKDRNVITTTDAERRCVKPDGLQQAIDEVVKQFGNQARSFIRPSGTEDVVRIYSEAQTTESAIELAKKIGNLVYDFANGIGSKF